MLFQRLNIAKGSLNNVVFVIYLDETRLITMKHDDHDNHL